MTHPQIVSKAIKKAIKGGWSPKDLDVTKVAKIEPTLNFPSGEPSGNYTLEDKDGETLYHFDPLILLFVDDKSFPKALWGEKREWNVAECQEEDGTGYSGYDIPYWQGMLQQMVIATDPIEYLGNNI